MNFLYLTSISASQRIFISSHQPCHHQLDKIHSSHSKWKDREKWLLEARTAGGTNLSSSELMENFVGCACNESPDNSDSSTQEECSLQFDFSSDQSPRLYTHLPVIDLAISFELCQEQTSACTVEIGPVCFHQSHQDFSGG